MLKEAFQFLYEKACLSEAPHVLKTDDVRKQRIVVGGEVKEYEIPPAPRHHEAHTLQSFMDYCDSRAGDQVVWHNRKQVVLVLDDEDRRDRAYLPLLIADQFKTLESLDGRSMNQRATIDLIRHDLADCVPADLLPAVRSIEVTSGGSRSSEINPGRERGTAEFREELQGAKDLPERFDARVPVYNVAGLSKFYVVACSFAYNLRDVTFQIQPLPGELDRAVESAQADLHEVLSNGLEGIPVYAGSP